MKIKVLDAEYDVYFKTSDEDVKLLDCGGYCDTTVKKIVVKKIIVTDNTVENIDSYSNEVLRHELIHAILYECGLSACSWAENEEIVDWLAVQFPKISHIFSIAGVEK